MKDMGTFKFICIVVLMSGSAILLDKALHAGVNALVNRFGSKES